MEFEFIHQFSVPVPRERVWDFLWDIERMATCFPGARDVRMVEPHARYEVVFRDRIGPLKATFPLEINVLEVAEPEHLRISAAGKDKSLGVTAEMLLDLTLSIGPRESTVLNLRTDVTMLGKLAMLGPNMIRRKAEDVAGQFAATLRAALAEEASGAPPPEVRQL